MSRKEKGGGRDAPRSTPTGKDGWEAGLCENYNPRDPLAQVYRAADLIEIIMLIAGCSLAAGAIIGKLMGGGIA